jgi:putative protease
VLPELVRSGVASLKIEGRLKSPEYVANITGIYRRAIDNCGTRPGAGGLELNARATAGSKSEIRNPKYEMEMAFSRGLHTGWFRGINNQQLVHARFGKKRGVYLGEVLRVHNSRAVVELEAPLKPGDGVVFDAGNPEEPEEGGRVYGVVPIAMGSGPSESTHRNASSAKDRNSGSPGETVAISFGQGDLDLSRVRRGDRLWKTSDPELDRRLRRSFEGDQPKFRAAIHMAIHGRVGEPLTLIVRDDDGHEVRVRSGVALAEAGKRRLSDDRLIAQLGRLGGTPFQLGVLDNRLEGEVILPVSELNRLRRDAVNQLEALRTRPRRWTLSPQAVLSPGQRSPSSILDGGSDEFGEPQLIVLVRNLAQLGVALQCGVQTIYCEFADPKHYREAVAQLRASHPASSIRHPASHPQIFVAPPRIYKTGEEWILKQVRSCDADGYLVRNYDHLKYFADCRCVGDFSLNVANSLTADYFTGRYHLERVTASYDLNAVQLEALSKAASLRQIEITIHQHMPMFHMEHCVFCAFLSKGTDYTNCGRPCDKHIVALKDRVGAQHPLTADAGCRNTVFNSMAQTGAEHVERMMALGVRWFRIEFLNETPEQVASTIKMYRSLLRGEITGTQLWRELKLINQLGVTRGPIG